MASTESSRQEDGESADLAAPHRLKDERGQSRGFGRVIMAAFWAAGTFIFSVAVWELVSESSLPIGPKLANLFAGLIYLAAASGLTHNGRRMRMVAWSAVSIAFAGPIIMGLADLGSGPSGNLWSPWADFGRETGFASLVLPLVGLAWLWWSNPRRIVEIAEGIERTTKRVQAKLDSDDSD